ncbi:MAG: class F sortase [Hamadaea sp.]|nr:class F sortase [Hamadaea sp.]
MRIPSQDVSAPVVAVGTGDRGNLALPAADRVGWWIGGATPADAQGTVVIAGHVDDRSGPGALHALRDLRPGARIEVVTDHATVVYAVVVVTRHPKQALPRSLFTTRGPPQLALITCGGPFDRATGHYRDNVVVLAAPA